MKRNIYTELLKWKNDINKKPLLLQGARQVGKTFIIEQFGKTEYAELIKLNFEQNPGLRSLFQAELKPEKIITNISLYLGKKIKTDNTLIFFDEIQVAPEALTSLKYFQEEAPAYHIIAAGSLLGVSVGKKNSFPVGKVNFLTMYPMTFSEYLIASGEEMIVENLHSKNDYSALPNIIHEKLLKHIKMYLFLGGMPEVLQDYLQNQDISSVREKQNDILEAYNRDFSKYTPKNNAIKISEIWQSIPYQLAKENKKFKYNAVKKKARASTYDQAIEWLRKAGLVNVVYNLKKPRLPLGGYADHAKFKLYFLDTGLLSAMLKLTSDIILKPTELFSEYNGAFIENFVASELINNGYKDLYYWKYNNSAEVDFIINRNNQILPVEVKSGLNRNLRSLRSYAEKYNPELIIRCSPRNFVQQGNFINMPLYAVDTI
ncbi:MAG: ATP-binding protein [Candidatus Cloacimonetes bacterium]|nr:ATP-binding protein [Candidatus Cloacimonadota bacterium]MCF7869348.1 ATP-binding protein [Candidatus Cloacimonadota bacterium]MCF7884743.1 ATP-binding protein [Candidatus Cloacimonadota bacterium]